MATRANRYRSDLPPLLYPSTLGTDRRRQIDVHDGLNGWKVIFCARSVISRERERVLGRRNWKNRGRKKRLKCDSPWSMEKREERELDLILSRLMNPRIGSWSSSYEERRRRSMYIVTWRVTNFARVTRVACLKLPSLLVFRSLARLASPPFSL